MTGEDAAGHGRRTIKSVETGLLVLRSLASLGGPAPLSAVARAAGIPAAQIHLYLSSLIAAGVARQSPHSGHYDLAEGAIQLGLSALARLDIFAIADRNFAAFASQTGRTCLVAVWGDAGPTVVRWYPGNPPVITTLAIGSVMPLLRSATGQVFFSFGDQQVMQAHAAAGKPMHAGQSPVDAETIRRRVIACGHARVDGDLIPGLRAISAPVFDLQGRLALVATAIATQAFDIASDTEADAALLAACRAVTQALGGNPG